MRRWNFAALGLAAALLWARPAAAQAPDAKPDSAANAALQYWQAFAQMPALDKEQEKLLEEWDKVPLDRAALGLLGKSHASLMYLRRGAKLRQCDWGLDYDDGIGLLLPHLAKARDLARLTALQARHDFEQGRWSAGREYATALMVLARHVGRDPIMISILVRYAIEGIAIDLVAAYAPELKAPPAKLAALHEALPAAATLPQAYAAEKQFFVDWMIRKLGEEERRKKGAWRDLWKKLWAGSEEVPAAARNVDSFEEATRLVKDLLPVYDQLAKLVALPPREFDAQYPEFKRKTKAAHPLAVGVISSPEKMLAAERRNQARMAMLFAAIAIAQDGPDKLRDFKDPFGTGPFEYRALDKGFELKSKLIFRDQPVTLTVGQRKRN